MINRPTLYLLNILMLISQILNCICLLGDPRETISSRTYKNRHKKGWNQLYWLLNAIHEDHCEKAYDRVVGKYQLYK